MYTNEIMGPMCVKEYVVSLTTGVWYYANASLAAQEGGMEGDKAYERAGRTRQRSDASSGHGGRGGPPRA